MLNKTTIMGRLTKDIEVRYSNGAEPLAIGSFTLAVGRKFKKDGQPDADFIRCKAFGKTAENIERFFKRGNLIVITGRIQTGSYEKEGVTIYTTDVIVEEFDFTGEKKDDTPTKVKENAPQNEELIDFDKIEADDLDDLPF